MAGKKKTPKLKKIKRNHRLEKLLGDYKKQRARQYRLDAVFRDMVAKQTGMTQTELSCAGFLAEKGTATPGELAEITGLTSGAITGVITRLEKKGCIIRDHDTKDRRKVILKAVPKKLAHAVLCYQPVAKRYYELLSTFDKEHLEFLMEHSKNISKIMEEEIARLEQMGGEHKKRSKKRSN